jgi:hypothetical protein
MEFFYTLVQSNHRPLCKEIHEDGSSSAQAKLSRGTFKKQYSSLQTFAKTLSSLSLHEAIILGVSEKDEGIIATKTEAKDGVIARTKEYFHWPKPFLLMFDYDPLEELGITIDSPKEYATYLAKLDPVFADVELLAVPSSSAYIINTITKKPLKPNGFHCYVVSEDATRIAPYLQSLKYKSWEMGLATYVCSVAGAKLERFIVDTAVFSPERLIYEAKPIVHAPWNKEFIEPYYQQGSIHPLIPVSYEPSTEHQKRAKEAISPQAKKETDAYFRTNIAPKYPDEEAKNLHKRFQEAIETHTLMEDFSLLLETDEEILVSELLKNPQAYDGHYCADPYEKDEGNTRAMIQTAYLPYQIHSFLHGGIEYKLPFEPTLKEVPKCEEPVSSQAFIDKAKEHFKGKEILFTSGHEKLFESMCHLFNYCTSLNKASVAPPALHQFPATTGAGKTTAMQLWAAMAPEETGILIGVYTIESAREIARAINDIAGEAIAKCTYSVNDGNPRSHEHVEPHELSTYPVAIITHQKYTNQLATDDEALIDYNKSPTGRRQCIIIDEELALMETESIELGVYESIIAAFRDAFETNSDAYPSFPQNVSDALALFSNFESDMYQMAEHGTICSMSEERFNYTSMASILPFKEYVLGFSDEQLLKIFTKLPYSDFFNAKLLRKGLGEFFDKLQFVLKHPAFFISSGAKSLVIGIKHLETRFGHSAILDATAPLNFTYQLMEKYQPHLQSIYKVPAFRQFDNCTLHIIKGAGLNQSRSKLFNTSLKPYQEYMTSTINPSDKVLIISYKGMIEKLKKFKDEFLTSEVSVIHWGAHTGSNKHRHCNKVFIIGWNFEPAESCIAKVVLGMGSVYMAVEDDDISNAHKNAMLESIITTALFQGLMRSRARMVTDIEGRPKPTEFYLFVPTGNSESQALRIVEKIRQQFPKIRFKEHILNEPPKKKSIPKSMQKIVDYLTSNPINKATMASDIYKAAGLNASQFQNVKNHPAFKGALQDIGIEFVETISGNTFQSISTQIPKTSIEK